MVWVEPSTKHTNLLRFLGLVIMRKIVGIIEQKSDNDLFFFTSLIMTRSLAYKKNNQLLLNTPRDGLFPIVSKSMNCEQG